MEEKIAAPVNRQSIFILSQKLFKCVMKRKGTSTIQALLQKGADVNARDRKGFNPLLLACLNNDYEDQVELLINAGADVHYTIGYSTPLHYAVYKGWKKVIRLLLKNGADINSETEIGFSPILFACSSQQPDVVELLINLGADIMRCERDKYTVLHYASSFGWVRLVQLLLQNGADPKAVGDNHGTPLHIACRNGHMEVVEHLLKAGADCHIADEKCETPFQILLNKSSPNIESVKLLIVHGAYIEHDDYHTIFNKNLLKENMLQDVRTCSQAILNKLNNKDLPLIYSLPVSKNMLPGIEFMKIGKDSEKFIEIKMAVHQEIQRKGHCNVLEVRPIVLSMLCVKSLIEIYKTIIY